MAARGAGAGSSPAPHLNDLRRRPLRADRAQAVAWGGTWFGYRYEVVVDDNLYSITARPVSPEAGTLRFARRSGEDSVRVNASEFKTSPSGVECKVAQRDPQDSDRTIRTYAYGVAVNATWTNTTINVADGDAVLVAADGQWKIGQSWQPNGPQGSDEKSTLGGDYRALKVGKVGAFTAKIEGDTTGVVLGDFGWFVSKKAGSLMLGVNDTDARNNTGRTHQRVDRRHSAVAALDLAIDGQHGNRPLG